MLRNNSGSLESFSEKEVSQHDDESSAWIVIDGYVYDVTSFLTDHPGGKEIVLPHLGKDATATFTDEREHVHSEAAYNILKKYRIGVLEDRVARDRKSANARLDGLVDVTKAMVPQVWRLGEDYDQWIHTHTGIEKIIIFPNFLEKFTRWPWWYIFIFLVSDCGIHALPVTGCLQHLGQEDGFAHAFGHIFVGFGGIHTSSIYLSRENLLSSGQRVSFLHSWNSPHYTYGYHTIDLPSNVCTLSWRFLIEGFPSCIVPAKRYARALLRSHCRVCSV